MRQQVVAVVEDDLGMLRSIERLLKAYQFQTAAFASAEAFLDDAAASTARCLVLDIVLRGMSGIELRRRLTASGSELPVIFISAVDDEDVRHMAVQSGCAALLRKPFPGSVLIGAINKAVADSASSQTLVAWRSFQNKTDADNTAEAMRPGVRRHGPISNPGCEADRLRSDAR